MSQVEMRAASLDEIGLAPERWRFTIEGQVQGVGFRPFVHRLAKQSGLTGWVANGPAGVVIEVQGDPPSIVNFHRDLYADAPSTARIDEVHQHSCRLLDDAGFSVRPSLIQGDPRPLELVDRVTCADCLAELHDPDSRRYRYPFITCTVCGPRFSILDALPYDRVRTAMAGFVMCADCQAEYDDPTDRRFHAETQACPACGPKLVYRTGGGEPLAGHDDAIEAAAMDLRAGRIVAVKGIGGFQLLADARNDRTIERLRQGKNRPDKPFALMVQGLDQASALSVLGSGERDMLTSAAGPIVIVQQRNDARSASISSFVAPGLSSLGLMLPTTPLHHLLLDAVGFPVVATSGNLAGEPMAIDLEDAEERLALIADRFLSHDRPIRRALDDSVQRLIADHPTTLRLGRGLAPLTVTRDGAAPSMLALGGHEKAAVAIASPHGMVLGAHVGDLDEPATRAAHISASADLQRAQSIDPKLVVCDQHPDYASSQTASRFGRPVHKIQHHAAHVFSCLADNQLAPPLLGFAFDGSGYGDDGTIWGGEAIMVTERGWRRFASFRPFALPGGEMAIREPRRTALALLIDALGEEVLLEMPSFMPLRSRRMSDLLVMKRMIQTKLNTPITSSVGRLFDGAAAISGLCQITTYGGQAAIEFEGHAAITEAATYSFDVQEPCRLDQPRFLVDWRAAIRALAQDAAQGRALGEMAASFHNGLAAVMVKIAALANQSNVVLSGGCFQNRYLTERAKDALEAAGFSVHLHRRVPPNDGGLAPGQIAAAMFERAREKH